MKPKIEKKGKHTQNKQQITKLQEKCLNIHNRKNKTF